MIGGYIIYLDISFSRNGKEEWRKLENDEKEEVINEIADEVDYYYNYYYDDYRYDNYYRDIVITIDGETYSRSFRY